MPGTFDDLSGRIFGRLLVLAFDHFDRHHVSYYRVRCDCGEEKVVQRPNLISGGTVSCTCYRKEQNQARCGEKSPVYRHGRCVSGKNSHEYEAWKWQQTLKRRRKKAA